jgi:hypothetical protein
LTRASPQSQGPRSRSPSSPKSRPRGLWLARRRRIPRLGDDPQRSGGPHPKKETGSDRPGFFEQSMPDEGSVKLPVQHGSLTFVKPNQDGSALISSSRSYVQR